MLEREETCLRNNRQEFWLVHPRRESIKVMPPGGRSSVYDAEGVIVSGALGGPVAVRDLFAH